MDTMDENCDDNTMTEQEISLQSALSSLADENGNKTVLESLEICTEHFSRFSISNVEAELLRWVMPVIQKRLQKIFDDNFLMSDTADDDFVMDILKENLQMASDFIRIVKIILEFAVENSEVALTNMKHTSSVSAQLILSSFEHCKNSSEEYKETFRTQLLDIFQATQEVHILFLSLLETCVVIGDNVTDDEIEILKEVLAIIRAISVVISDLNLRSMIANWKGYTGIAQKFSKIFIEHIDFEHPIQCLASEIARNVFYLDELKTMDFKFAIPVIKKTGFLVKMFLKLIDIFWDTMEKIRVKVLDLCCIIYSFLPERYVSQGYPEEIVILIKNSIFASTDPFIARLSLDEYFVEMLCTKNILKQKFSNGFLSFMNTFLKCIAANETVISLDHILSLTFECTKQCFEEFASPFASIKNIFDNLVVNISASVIIHQEWYAKTEIILLENILQENLWNALLAMDVWCLLLRKSTRQFCLETLFNLIRIYEEIDFGINTHRLEKVYLKCLIQRVFSILPESAKNEAIETTGRNGVSLWKITGFENYPVPQRHVVERLCTSTLEKIEEVGRDNFNVDDFKYMVENLESLSSAKFQDMGPNSKNLVDAVGMFWESSYGHLTNNVFKNFIDKLCKMTRTLISEFDNKQLFTLLNQLKILSTEDCFKLYVCDILSSLADKNTNEFGEDRFKFFDLMSGIFYPTLITTTNNVIKQNALEVLEKFVATGKEEVVREILIISNEVQSYFKKELPTRNFDEEYFRTIGALKYEHQCVKWQDNAGHVSKRIKLDEVPRKIKEKPTRFEKQHKDTLKKPRRVQNVEVTEQTVGDIEDEKPEVVNEAIASIKGEVKSLMNVLKTEKLTQKNISDLKMISNQLLSLM